MPPVCPRWTTINWSGGYWMLQLSHCCCLVVHEHHIIDGNWRFIHAADRQMDGLVNVEPTLRIAESLYDCLMIIIVHSRSEVYHSVMSYLMTSSSLHRASCTPSNTTYNAQRLGSIFQAIPCAERNTNNEIFCVDVGRYLLYWQIL